MVGVPGGSRGCARCRKRKVKCDQGKPACQRCRKAGLECGGYPDNFLHDPRSYSHERDTASNPKSKFRKPAPSSADDKDYEQVVPFYDMNSMTIQQRKVHARITPLLLNNWMPEFLDLLPFVDNICVSYTSVNLLKGAGRFKEVKNPFVLPGLSNINKDGITRDSIMALSCVYFGQQQGQSQIARRGNALYVTALKELNEVLGDPRRSRRVEVFEAIMVLTLYEFLVAKRTTGWVSHCLGLETLFKSYGPGAFNTPSTLAFFENCRQLIIQAALMSGRTTILAEPDWKNIPWADNPEAKSDMQYLYDIWADLPEIFQQLGRSLESPLDLRPDHTMSVEEIYQRSLNMLRALDKWRRTWHSNHYEDFFETEQTYVPKTWVGRSEDLGWKTCWHFSTLYIAYGYTLYHAILICVLKTMWNCEISDLLVMEHPTIDRSQQLYAAGIEICRCVDYHLIDPLQGAGSLFIIAPVRCAWKILGEDSVQGQWLSAAMKDISTGERGGWAIAEGTLVKWGPSRASPEATMIYDNELPVSPVDQPEPEEEHFDFF